MRKSKHSKGKQTVQNTKKADSEVVIRELLDGNQQIISHGPSQYRGGGVSACGLASLNCVRIILTAENGGLRDKDLLSFILAPSTAEEITSICTKWSSRSHLEVEDIFRVPLFSQSLTLVSTKFAKPSFKQFKNLLIDLKKNSPNDTSAAVVITRPPEIITCIKIAASSADVFLVFDSHPRPAHPNGAGFTLNTSIDDTANHLAHLLAVDSRILADGDMQWQIQLLANFSGHIFLCKARSNDVEELTQTVLESSIAILALRAEVADLKYHNSFLTESNRYLAAKLEVAKTKRHEDKGKLRFTESDLCRSQSRRRGRYSVLNDHIDIPPVASTSKVHNGLKNEYNIETPRSPSRQAIVYYSGDPVPPLKSKSKNPASHAHMDVNISNSFDRENSALPFAQRLQPEWEDSQGFSAEIALVKQREFEDEGLRLDTERMKLATQSVQTIFKCTVCLDEYPEDYAARVAACDHTFCRECLRSYIISKLNEHRYPIFCPVCITTEHPREPGVVTDILVQDLGIPESYYLILQELQLSLFSILLHCRRCGRSAFVDRDEYQESIIIACPLPGCSYVWCKTCLQEISIGGPQHSCDGSSELEHLIKTRGWKRCPGCTTPIQKDSGCNHMTCTSPGCNTHFCYICGKSIIKSAVGTEIRTAIVAHSC